MIMVVYTLTYSFLLAMGCPVHNKFHNNIDRQYIKNSELTITISLSVCVASECLYAAPGCCCGFKRSVLLVSHWVIEMHAVHQ